MKRGWLHFNVNFLHRPFLDIVLPVRSNGLKKLTKILLVFDLKTTVVINKIYSVKGFQKNIFLQKIYNFLCDGFSRISEFIHGVQKNISINIGYGFLVFYVRAFMQSFLGPSNYNSAENEQYFL